MYFKTEYELLEIGKVSVLGVAVRGTDYIRLKPKNHPKQPTVEQIIAKVQFKMNEGNYAKIYLDTEEKYIYEMFCKKFGADIILINNRQWYDQEYKNMGNELVDIIHFQRDNDDYLKGIEYLSSILLLSKCKGLIAGISVATFAALFFIIYNINIHIYLI